MHTNKIQYKDGYYVAEGNFIKSNKKPKSNLLHQRFGKLFVKEIYGTKESNSFTYWMCQCDCGKLIVIRGTNLSYGRQQSCGCIPIVHSKRGNSTSWKGYGSIGQALFSQIKRGAKNRNLEFNITIEEIWSLYLKQDKKCALTNIELRFPIKQKDHTGTASLDRIDASSGYIIDNVQWVHKDINYMKMDYDQKHFIEMCKKVAKKYGDW